MNVYEAQVRVARIAAEARDDEAAHIDEDALYKEFIEWVRDEAPPPFSGVAREVLKTDELNFARWCA